MLSRRHGGFRLGRKLLSVWRRALCHRRRRGYLRLKPCRGDGDGAGAGDASPLFTADDSKKHHHHDHQQHQQFVARQRDDGSASPRMLTAWGRSLARRLRTRLLRRRGAAGKGGGGRLLEEPAEATTPKGQVAVYVGGAGPGGGESSMRYVVPVVYFNHPLFGELLREAEEEFGFQHPGGITIPCAASRFERAAAVAAGKKVPGWW